jgi:hypothetical protein
VRLPSVPHLLCLSPCLAIISENQLIWNPNPGIGEVLRSLNLFPQSLHAIC